MSLLNTSEVLSNVFIFSIRRNWETWSTTKPESVKRSRIKDRRPVLLKIVSTQLCEGDLYAPYESTIIVICHTACFQMYFSLFVQTCPQNSALSLSSCIEMTEVRPLITGRFLMHFRFVSFKLNTWCLHINTSSNPVHYLPNDTIKYLKFTVHSPERWISR